MIFDLIMAAAGATTPGPATGQVVFDDVGGTWVVPAGVTSISAVAVGRGGNVAGGNLSYVNAVPVTPGESLNVTISASESSIYRGSAPLLKAPGNTIGPSGAVGTAFAGGAGAGGGAGGYAGTGGISPSSIGDGTAGTGGAGGGGYNSGTQSTSGGGGGVGLLGQGTRGAGGTSGSPGGKGGSGGTDGAISLAPGNYGGASGGKSSKGGVRIMWGGGRSYPSNAGDV